MIEKHPVLDRGSWLHMRRQDLTASDVGAVAGVDKFRTALGVYAEKSGAIISLDDDTPIMRRGRWLESAVLAAVREEKGWEIRPVGLYFRDSELHLGATPDAVAISDKPGVTNVQCKVVSRPVYDRDWEDGPPMSYVLQTLTEGMLMDAQQSVIAALVIDTYSAELYLHDVPRHAAAEARIAALAKKFWDNVRTGNKPRADYARDAEIIEALYPLSQAEPVLDLSMDNRIAVLLPEYAALKHGMSIDKKRLGEIETEIKEKLGASEVAELPGWKLSWKTQHRKEHLVKASTYRVLRVTDLDDDEQTAAA